MGKSKTVGTNLAQGYQNGHHKRKEHKGVPIKPAATPQSAVMIGVVKFFSQDKGYGFIIPEDGGTDIFLHANEVRASGLQPTVIEPEKKIRFSVKDTPKGRAATSLALVV